ncbi:MAG: hypothetical protein NC300_08960 [Bacteroidales bacterium]|nr:hypothetical protein [Clostridium sp.]MCM1204259.1 hypothetical protein [Bacteroidales bacterium]
MIEVSITGLKTVIDELQVCQTAFRREIDLYEQILTDMDIQQDNQSALKKILEDLNEEYALMKRWRRVLEESIRCYEDVEKQIIRKPVTSFSHSLILKTVEINEVKEVLKKYHINFI